MKMTKLERAAAEYLIKKYPEEGVLLIKGGKLIKVENIHQEPTKGFYVDPMSYIEHYPIEGIIHSHPDQPATPSGADIQLRKSLNVPSCIMSVTNKDVVDIIWH